MDPLLSMKRTELPVKQPTEVAASKPVTNEMLTVLKMYREQVSMSKIGKEINKSRNAVAGIIHRCRKRGLLNDKTLHKFAENRINRTRPKLVTVKKLDQKPIRSTPFLPKPPLPPIVSIPKVPRTRLKLVDSPTAVTFEELRPHHCRWPAGDPKHRDFRFCGCQRLAVGSYCEAHTVASLNPLTKRKR